MMKTIHTTLLLLGWTGAFVFSVAFVVSILNPGYVENIAKDIIRHQVEKKVHEKIESLDAMFLSAKAAHLLKGHSEEIATAKHQLEENVPERIASVIAEMAKLDCECRKNIGISIRAGIVGKIDQVSQEKDKLTLLIRTKYMETAEKLTREFRIFTATNALIFALLAFAALIRRGASVQLLPTALVLVVAASVTAYFYLFNQNWLHTILFSDYLGFTYVFYLSVFFAFLCDILFNRARVTTRLLNEMFNMVGSNFQLLPC